jgi:hypothetical protein
LHSLGCLQRVFQESPDALHQTQKLSVAAIVGAAASSNSQLSGQSYALLIMYCQSIPTASAVSLLQHIALHHVDKDRMRTVSLKGLADLMPRIASENLMIR